MKTSIATVSISGNLKEKLEAIANAGFDGVEIFEQDFLTFDASPRQVGEMVRDAGLELTLFQPFRDFETMPSPHRARAFERARRKFDVMSEMGAKLMLICSNVSPISLGGVDRAAADFHELGDLAAERGIRVGFEALAWGRHFNDHRDAWEVVRRADHDNVGIILDSFHTLSRGIDVNSIRTIPADKIFIVQLADAPKFDMDLLYWSRHFRNMPGEGDLPVAEFMAAVVATGYDDVISLEIFNDQFRAASPRIMAEDGHRSLVYLMDRVREIEPQVQQALAIMPPRINARGVSFVEFATGRDEAIALVGMLTSLGFACAGQHRSKDVALYQQGNIRVVINTEKTGLAHSSYATHGTSAYAFGLIVDDVEDTIARAQALGAESFFQPVGDAELQIPAIRGVGGGLIYFLDEKRPLRDVWSHEFKTTKAADNSVGLERIDHIAQTMPYDQMLSWVLFYTSIFKAGKSPMVDIVDPAGIVRSQIIENDDKSLRITMNGAENRATVAGRFVAESFGSGIQHIAFATADIFATIRKLRTNGFEPLAIPRNYYDDIEARFGLDPDLVDLMRDYNVLYDQDAQGEYFQIYSPTLNERLFFEIVQRVGYAGYGGPNAPFRIAAQRRHLRPITMPQPT